MGKFSSAGVTCYRSMLINWPCLTGDLESESESGFKIIHTLENQVRFISNTVSSCTFSPSAPCCTQGSSCTYTFCRKWEQKTSHLSTHHTKAAKKVSSWLLLQNSFFSCVITCVFWQKYCNYFINSLRAMTSAFKHDWGLRFKHMMNTAVWHFGNVGQGKC